MWFELLTSGTVSDGSQYTCVLLFEYKAPLIIPLLSEENRVFLLVKFSDIQRIGFIFRSTEFLLIKF